VREKGGSSTRTASKRHTPCQCKCPRHHQCRKCSGANLVCKGSEVWMPEGLCHKWTVRSER